MHVTDDEIISVLQRYLFAYGPCGYESEIRDLVLQTIRECCDSIETDPGGNLVAKISGQEPCAPAVKVVGHLDEISMIIKRIHPDGSLHLRPLGCLYPGQIGQGPVEILAKYLVKGILSFGCTHVSSESHVQYETIPQPHFQARAHTWNDVSVFTGLSVDRLKEAGVKPGIRVVIARERRTVFAFEDYYAAYYMDDRAPLTAMWAAIKTLSSLEKRPKGDTYFIFTSNEEVRADGACYAISRIPGDICISMEIGPVQKEFDVELTENPIIAYQDGFTLYDFDESEKLVQSGKAIGIEPQIAVYENLGSDASIAKSFGHVAKALMIGIPTSNTHGFEIIHKHSIVAAANLLIQYLGTRPN